MAGWSCTAGLGSAPSWDFTNSVGRGLPKPLRSHLSALLFGRSVGLPLPKPLCSRSTALFFGKGNFEAFLAGQLFSQLTHFFNFSPSANE
jgi:hypothetical protein